MTTDSLILIVEDDALIAMDLEDELADHGLDSVHAATVSKAESILKNRTPSFAILDMNLRSETTFELAARLRNEEIPFVFLSGNDSSSLPDHLVTTTILTKPVVIKDAVDLIRAMEKKL